MKDITYDVRIYKTEVYRGTNVTTYTVRWKVGPKPWKAPYRIKAQAESFLAELRAAAKKGEAFSLSTGRPVSWARDDNAVTWYDFAISYVDMKWRPAAGKYRRDIARALVEATFAMLTGTRGKPDDDDIRIALRKWAFNTKNRDSCSEDAALILKWLANNTRPVTALADPTITRAVLEAIATRQDGKPAAASTVRRNRAILHNACEYGVERGLLASNPIKAIKWKAPKSSSEVDRRSVVSHGRARLLLGAVGDQEPSGPRLVAFFGVMYYSALRPEEAVSLRRDNLVIPPLVLDEETGEWEEPKDDWGELRFCTAAPEAGAKWTDSGQAREERSLKARPAGEWRRVPTPPQLTTLLRHHLKEFDTGPGGRIFCGSEVGSFRSPTTARRGPRRAEQC